MRIQSVQVSHYRSAIEVDIQSVGDFNVFIGRNNAGKSTLLTAIRAFFRCLHDGGTVALDPIIGQNIIDFSLKDVNRPIEITVTFVLAGDEWKSLANDIASETPQVRNAIESLQPGFLLSVSVAIMPPPRSFGYVQTICLIRPGRDEAASGPQQMRILLRVDPETALELAQKQREIRELASRMEALKKLSRTMDDDDFRIFKQRLAESGGIGRFASTRLLGSEVSQSTTLEMENLIRDAGSLGELQSAATHGAEALSGSIAQMTAKPISRPVETFSGSQTSIPQFAVGVLNSIGLIKVLYLTEQRRQVGKEEAERLLQLKIQRGGDQTLDNIKQTVQSLLGVKIDAFTGELGPASGRGAEMDVDDFLLEVNGSGIREALRLILDVEFQKPALLLVEEPEVHLHPALETSMMRFLKSISPQCQIFISTHSTNFLDSSEMKNVYLVSKAGGATNVQPLDIEGAESLLPREMGIRLSSLFMFDRLVFVEGPSDEAIIREWATILGVNLSQANVGFISLGGSRNFGHFAAEAIIGFLSKRQVHSYFILDRDERTDQEVQDLQRRLRDRAEVVILHKREIENFLLIPRAIGRFVVLKSSLSGQEIQGAPTADSVSKSLARHCESLKQRTIDKRVAHQLCTPLYPKINWDATEGNTTTVVSLALEAMKNELETNITRSQQTIKEITQSITQQWAAKRFDLVEGDILLDLTCQDFGVRFNKNADGARLASVVDQAEIDPTIRNLIQRIGAL